MQDHTLPSAIKLVLNKSNVAYQTDKCNDKVTRSLFDDISKNVLTDMQSDIEEYSTINSVDCPPF